MLRGIVLGAVLFCASAAAAFADDGHHCKLTADDKAANARMSFEQFIRNDDVRSSWRGLMDRDCPGRAAEAADDYLVNGPALTADQKSDVLFHEGQALAIMGDDAQASRLIAAAIMPDRGMRGDLDWTTYLTGTWAFLVNNRAALDAAIAKLANESGEGNRANAAELQRLAQCFDQPYSDAYRKCRPR